MTIITTTTTHTPIRRILLVLAVVLALTQCASERSYYADYDYKPNAAPRPALSVRPTTYAFVIRPGGATVFCDRAAFIDEKGVSHAVVCSSLDPMSEIEKSVWNSSLIREANGGTVTIVPADYMSPSSIAQHPSVRFTSLLPVVQGTGASAREQMEAKAREQVGKTIALELPISNGDDVVRQRYEFTVDSFRIKRRGM